MIEVRLDGEMIRDKEQLHDQLAEIFRFPSWYGANLDALYDRLTDIHEDTRLMILHSDKLRKTLGPYGEKLFEVLCQAEKDNRWFHID